VGLPFWRVALFVRFLTPFFHLFQQAKPARLGKTPIITEFLYFAENFSMTSFLGFVRGPQIGVVVRGLCDSSCLVITDCGAACSAARSCFNLVPGESLNRCELLLEEFLSSSSSQGLRARMSAASPESVRCTE
jgi:hypothetical protein